MSSDVHFGGDGRRGPLENVPTECYDVLCHPQRVRLLDILGDHQTRLSLAALTTELIEKGQFDVPNGRARHEVRIDLVHNHLPRLAEYDIVEWDAETGVELADEPPVHPNDLSTLLDLYESENGDRLLEALVHPVRMHVLSSLAEHDRPLSVEQLASTVAAQDVDSLSDPERVKLSLYHAHLPLLADIGVLEFDHESGLVTRHEKTMPTVQISD
ncbi:DUF7344 domain-containing protein [Natronorubrum halophilum]|uniref:DUF7344 domain-containing protein n=1 Tax=Natronorubrum halophilum TaxID=1702106 RepID=UPI0010C198F5|nr:ArsR family transcriptional regulator [Natronorubrum halophilum]